MIEEKLPPTELLIGHNNLEIIKTRAKNLGKNAMLVTGKSSMEKLGLLKKCKDYLEDIDPIVFNKIPPNPTDEIIREGVELFKENNCDLIIALGGGSSIDAAKLISLSAYNKKDVWGFTEKQIPKGNYPIIAAPTTSGTGSHVTHYAVVTNKDTKEKKTVKTHYIHPNLAIYDIEIAKHMPKKLTASTGIDVFMHALETFTKKGDHPITDMFSINAISLLSKNLPKAYENGDDKKARTNMALADTYAGIAIDSTGTHSIHGFAHPLSGRNPKLAHGEALAIIAPQIVKYNEEKADESLKRKQKVVAQIFGKESLSKAIKKLNEKIGFDKGLSDYFTKEQIEKLKEDCKGYRKGSIDKNPIKMNEKQIEEIIEESK